MQPIRLDGLSKDYGEVLALDSLSLDVAEGEIFGYLGPNGAGKTTTIRILLGLLNPTSGTAKVFGVDVSQEDAFVEVKQRIGYLPERLGFSEDVTGQRVLDYHGSVKGDTRRDELLDRFTPPLDRPVRDYSSGNKRMLGIVQAFMHDPDLVIMDEPTGGLDPLKQAEFNTFLRSERDRGTTIFFSSHVLSEVRQICDRVGILRDGHLVALEDLESLLKTGGKRVMIRSPDQLKDDIGQLAQVVDMNTTGDRLEFTYLGDYNYLIQHLTDYTIRDIDIREPPIEDVFMHFYGGQDGDDHSSALTSPMEDGNA